VGRQNLLFSYFQATLAAEVHAAKAEGKYSEGVSDLPGQHIARDGEAQVGRWRVWGAHGVGVDG
jgi:hypothetical protein